MKEKTANTWIYEPEIVTDFVFGSNKEKYEFLKEDFKQGVPKELILDSYKTSARKGEEDYDKYLKMLEEL